MKILETAKRKSLPKKGVNLREKKNRLQEVRRKARRLKAKWAKSQNSVNPVENMGIKTFTTAMS